MLEIYAIRMVQNGVEYWFQRFYDPSPPASLHQEAIRVIWTDYIDMAKLFVVGNDPLLNWGDPVDLQHARIDTFIKHARAFCEWPIEKVRIK
jgi:hypothetical protein